MRRSVVVTGANSGIGLHSVLHLAQLGFDVAGTVRSEETAAELAKAAVAARVHIEPLVVDLTDDDACDAACRHRDIWAVVNNAGYMNAGAIEDVAPADALAQLDVMVVAPMRVARCVLPRMRRHGQGRIVNVSSILAHSAAPVIGWYQAAKHALSAATDALREEVARFGVDVVTIEPGGFDTHIWTRAEEDVARRGDGSAYAAAYTRARAAAEAIRPALGDPRDVARVIGTALKAGRPHATYRVGGDARLLELARHLVPRRSGERAMRAALGL